MISDVQKFWTSEVQNFWSSEVRVFRSSEVMEFISSDVRIFGSSEVHNFMTSLGILLDSVLRDSAGRAKLDERAVQPAASRRTQLAHGLDCEEKCEDSALISRLRATKKRPGRVASLSARSGISAAPGHVTGTRFRDATPTSANTATPKVGRRVGVRSGRWLRLPDGEPRRAPVKVLRGPNQCRYPFVYAADCRAAHRHSCCRTLRGMDRRSRTSSRTARLPGVGRFERDE